MLLLLLAIAGGTLLTLLYEDRPSLALGAPTGLALLSTVGFLVCWWQGLHAAIFVSAAALLLPWLLLLNRKYRRAFAKPHFDWKVIAGFAALAIILGLVFSRQLYSRPDGLYTGFTNNIGDLPLHLQVIASFTQGHNFQVEDPTYAGARFTYSFLCDFLTAMLVQSGMSVASAMWMQSMVLSLSLVALLYRWTLDLTRSRLAALMAPVLVIFSGGFGWLLLFQDVRKSDHGLIPLLAHLPHDYTIMNPSLYRWGNSLTTLLVPQRSLLFALPLALLVFRAWWKIVNLPKPEDIPHSTTKTAAAAQLQPEASAQPVRAITAAGICVGLLPLIHAHTFLVVLVMAVCLAVIFRARWQLWIAFLAVSLVIASPEIIWLSHTYGIQARSFLGWQTGWDHTRFNPTWFWFANTGMFIPLLLAALFWRDPRYRLPRTLLLYWLPFALCFIVPNLVRLAPWIWDNIKVLFYWYLASVPLVAWLLARALRRGAYHRWIAAALFASLILAGSLDVLRVITGASPLREFDADGIATANLISQIAPPRAVVLHAPVYDSPVFLTGRRSLLGYPGWIWSRGLDYVQRQTDIQSIYSGNARAASLMRQYQVDYVLLGPQERGNLTIDDGFWSSFPVMAHIGQYRLLKVTREK